MSLPNQFHVPLTVFAAGRLQLISGVEDASQFLFDHWEQNDGEMWDDAMQRCAAVDVGLVTILEARTAFVDAAKSAGFVVFGEWSLL